MSTKNEPKGKPRTKPAKSKGGRSAGRAPAKARTAKPRAAKPKTNRGGAKRLRPGELDGLVIADMRGREDSLPLGATAIAKGIERSSGAVGNCLERLAKADDSPVRRVQAKPRTYDLKAEAPGTSS
ncbi:MAG: hypothetical protein JST59_20870 [Actinobacteria bacterium]|nr:hypothetical protein [Actinomycetota bacterium]